MRASEWSPPTRAPAHCQLTGAQPGLPSEGRHVRLTLSAKAIKTIDTIDTIGVEAAVARIRARGVKV